MEKRTEIIKTIFIKNIKEVELYKEGNSFTTRYQRKEGSDNLFDLIYYDLDEDICAICGGNENVDHSNCEEFTVVKEEDIIDIINEWFEKPNTVVQINDIAYSKITD